MNYEKMSCGAKAPYEVEVLIEIAANSGSVKYEFDKERGMLVVDRIMQTSMQYPCNYGFIPHTLAGDGDPVDVLVYTNHSLLPGSMITAKPIGVLVTEDEKGRDEKVLAVPAHNIDLSHASINSYSDLPEVLLQKIEHFFTHYKAIEKGKWVKVEGWDGAGRAHQIIKDAMLASK